MKKKTFLKSLSFTSLALLMGAAGVFAFAPLGASPSVANASEMVDQINTKADGENIKYAPSALGLDPENDPVIYTTESGLEIKYGGENVNDQIASGQPLAGYPYFTMGTYNGYEVNWVIIGRNTNDTVFTSAISSYLYSTWKTNNNISYSGLKPFAKYWFNGGGYETTTPAGSAINGVVPSKSYVADVTKATKSVVANAEVPSGCVLAISECMLTECVYYPTVGTDNSTNYEVSTLKNTMNTLYNSSLNLTEVEKKLVVSQDLVQIYSKYPGSGSTSSSYTNFIYSSSSSQQKFFPLGALGSYTSVSQATAIKQNYKIETYLTTSALRKVYVIGTTTSARYWLRSGIGHRQDPLFVKLNGDISDGDTTAAGGSATASSGSSYDVNCDAKFGVRPACVISLA